MKELEKVYEIVKNGGLIYLFGDLGSGKTTFVQNLAQKFAIDSFSVKSPTYNYIRHYKAPNAQNFYHLDLYRLENSDDLLIEEIKELLEDDQNIIAIEWPEKVLAHLEKPKVKINLNYQNSERTIRLDY